MTEYSKPITKSQQIISVMWPSFLTAGVATILLFSAFDPQLIVSVSGYGEISRMGGYTMGFFILWLLTTTSSALTCYFRKPCDDIGRK